MVAAEPMQHYAEGAVMPPVPGDTEGDPPHEQLLMGMGVVLYPTPLSHCGSLVFSIVLL